MRYNVPMDVPQQQKSRNYESRYNILLICLDHNTMFLNSTKPVVIRFRFNSIHKSVIDIMHTWLCWMGKLFCSIKTKKSENTSVDKVQKNITVSCLMVKVSITHLVRMMTQRWRKQWRLWWWKQLCWWWWSNPEISFQAASAVTNRVRLMKQFLIHTVSTVTGAFLIHKCFHGNRDLGSLIESLYHLGNRAKGGAELIVFFF